MKRLVALVVSTSMAATVVSASPASVTATVTLRSGPGSSYGSVATLKEGSEVDLGECDASGAWCAVKFSGRNGFVSGRYISRTESEKPSWPRSFTTNSGATLTLFQPQITDWRNFTEIDALIAAELTAKDGSKPIYGVIGVQGKTVADDDGDNVLITDVQATQIDFSTLGRKELANLALDVGKLMPTDPITVSQERLTASLADYKRLNDVNGIKSDPPLIVVSTDPAILVQTDGKEVLSPMKGVEGLQFIVNTNWDVFKTTDPDAAYYLRDDKSWLTAKTLDGVWSQVATLPDTFAKLPDDDNWKDAKAAMPPAPFADDKLPKVVHSDVPTEMLLFDGQPKLETVPGTGLKWASNTTSDVFYRDADRHWYILLSGRWFSSKSLDGPWTFATPTLPADFQNIPEDAPYYQVRASVPGTSESAEARLKASIPQVARVSVDGSVTADVAYSGEPKFEPIDGTSLTYAVNSNEEVIKVGDAYFMLKDGVWFTANSPNGPWTVAKAVPDEIYKIPPSSPVYNATYVRVYQTEPDAVWFGYTMGYLGAYLAWDTFVYGTGWAYRPYWDFGWAGGYWPYYPRPVTYGVGAFYNPAYGTFGRYGYAYGPYRGIAGGAAYNPATGTYIRGGAIAGPNGQAGFITAYNPRTGNAAFARGGSNIYGRWGTAGVRHGGDFARMSGGQTANGGAVNWHTSAGNRGFVAGRQGGDIYAGRDGNVYRKDDGQWQKHTDNGWQDINRPNAEGLKQQGQNFATAHPDTAKRIQNNVSERIPRGSNASGYAPDHLAIDRAGREAGNMRELGRDFGRGDIGEFNRPQFGGREFGGFHGGGGARFRR
ncbi:SH3 domain-containing protein [Rhizobium sp. GCM10022189]|uniref:SH3 domain-containing protein n=1 Tax=Rhizobium sp. GCM10022189 TaxID=3252654 RepID=UPI003623D040